MTKEHLLAELPIGDREELPQNGQADQSIVIFDKDWLLLSNGESIVSGDWH